MNTPESRYAFFEGKIVPIEQAKVSVMTHALNYGTGAFSGLRGYWNPDHRELYVFRPIDHFERLTNSAKLLLIDMPYTPEQLRDIVIDLLLHEGFREDVYIRPLVYKSELGIGVKLHGLKADFTMFALPFGRYLEHDDGLSVCTSSWRRVDDTAIPARGKISGAYANSALIKSEAAMAGFDDAIVLNQDGHVSEACAANLFMFRKGKIVTPPVSANILEGITRQTLFTLFAEEMGMQVVEREIDRTELYSADEVFMCGTGVQISAVTSVDHRPIGTGKLGPVVAKMRTLYNEVVRGNLPRYYSWLQPVFACEEVYAD